MENLKLYKTQIKEVEDLINKLDKGDLAIDELVRLETLTRELHERSIILKYKAFETKSNVSTIVETAILVEEKLEEESPSIDFSIFEEEEAVLEEEEVTSVEEAEKVEVEVEEIIAEVKEEEPAMEEITLTESPEAESPETVVEKVPENASGTSFMDSFTMEDNSLNTQFGGAKIDTLIGAFGLNQKLRYINELFDGSSESFGEAIKLLDSESSMESARPKLDQLASQNSWDPEDESVVEFIAILNRRYA